MKIRNLALIILMTTFFIILGTKGYATTGKVNSETVRLRKEPNTESTILEQLDKNDEVEILEQEDGWYKVKTKTEQGTIIGYISEKLIDVEETNVETNQENTENSNNVKNNMNVENVVEETTEVSVEEPKETTSESQENNETLPAVAEPEQNALNNIEENNEYIVEQEVSIKVLPLINSREKAKISGNVKVAEIINDWSKIENDAESGWIRTNTLKESLTQTEVTTQEPVQQTQQLPEETNKEETTTVKTEEPKEEETKEAETSSTINKTGYVSAEGLKVRKEPNTSSEELDSLKKNDKVEIIGQSGNWYKINLNGKTGYVSAKYISDTKIPETTSRSGSALKSEETSIAETATNEQETPETPVTSESSTAGTTGTAVVEYAKQYLGYKYVSGGASPSTGFDCSGFTTYVYKHFGISLYRTSGDQIKNGVAVEKSDLQPGDLVLFNNDGNTRIGHVGIYVGNGNFIHASNPKEGVKITSLSTSYYQKRYVGARRVI